MISYLKCQFYFIFNQKTLIISVILNGLIGLIFVYQSNFYLGKQIIDANQTFYNAIYIENCVIFVKIISVTYCIFLFSTNYTIESNKFAIYLLNYKKYRKMFNFTKLVILMTVFLWFMFNEMILFHLVLEILTPLSVSFTISVPIFFVLFLESLFFGLLASIIIFLIKHPFSAIISTVIFWILEIFSSSQDFKSAKFVNRIKEFIPLLYKEENSYIVTSYLSNYILLILLVVLIVYMFSTINEL
ncbi:MAG: hypothetical protein PHC62_04265 [Candidatus Izemoplasmatales bacterium]|nr:hypothetical protein [Candidatus Izemoplasmatales bacterium]